jgi:HAD superfamily hydrolase (TIGR01549 family)
MLDTILFDLDGTLLPLDMERFTAIYFGEMGKVFTDLIDPKLLAKHIWAATNVMVNNTEFRTNETVFMEHFETLIGGELPTYRQRLDRFYDEGFLKTRAAAVPHPAIPEAVALLKEKGYRLVVATNPLFPEKAIYHRIRWAGFEPSDFTYITSYEQNHYCKPQPHFYRELLQAIGKTADQCLMVGNDVQEDMVAATLGITTFLVTDHLIHRTVQPIEHADSQGTYQDFLEFVKQLPAVRLLA